MMFLAWVFAVVATLTNDVGFLASAFSFYLVSRMWDKNDD